MLKQGPIPRAVHGVLEYPLGALFIAAPFLFGFDDVGAATAASIVLGVLVLIGGATTSCFPTSLIKVIPIGAHIVLDFVLGAVLIAAPFAFGFSDESGPTAFFIIAGVLALLVNIATRWERDERSRNDRGRPQAPSQSPAV